MSARDVLRRIFESLWLRTGAAAATDELGSTAPGARRLEPILLLPRPKRQRPPDSGASGAAPLAGSPPALGARPERTPAKRSPPVTRFPNWQPPCPSPEEYARRFLAWLQMPGDDGRAVEGPVLARDLIEMFRDFCADQGLAERPWNPVSTELRRLTGETRKRYCWHRHPDDPPGTPPARLRVFTIPPRALAERRALGAMAETALRRAA
jgi:hypothetical protein